MTNTPDTRPIGAMDRKTAAAYLSISTRKLDDLLSAGILPKGKLGTKTLVRKIDLDKLLAELTGQPLEKVCTSESIDKKRFYRWLAELESSTASEQLEAEGAKVDAMLAKIAAEAPEVDATLDELATESPWIKQRMAKLAEVAK